MIRVCVCVCVVSCRTMKKDHLDKLHLYNDVKDLGQALLGQLGWDFLISIIAFFLLFFLLLNLIATIEATTTKDLYQRFDLSLSD